MEKVKVRGKKRMKELGMKEIVLWLDPKELILITAAARRVRKPLATWIRQQAFHAAEAANLERIRAERREDRGE